MFDMSLVYDHSEKQDEKVSTLKSFLYLMKGESTLSSLHRMIDHYAYKKEKCVAHRVVNQVHSKKQTNREFRLSAQTRAYKMENIILDLGSNVNVILRQIWEMMGHPKMIWSPIKLRLVNQHNIVPVGRLTRVHVNIDGVCSVTYFKVIDIVYGSTPYPTILGLDWAFNNHVIIELKKR
jgi:hypothetical protein